ncbi:uncharacterized protein LOC123554203 isoform X2 [Mercenaria mercenaria]|uniref:uncharacterized protein LOC123554203 isoform X2 n=1 Tax=Mercenaria mercenaria TaxID=6596 RepID=UPI00234E821E|nr:uncharacterized protein LOC123554203 isoform X2 [Mercenaria mercenaria]
MEGYDMADHMKLKSSDAEIRPEFSLDLMKTSTICENPKTRQKRLPPGFGFSGSCKGKMAARKQPYHHYTTCGETSTSYKNVKCSGETVLPTNYVSSNPRPRRSSVGKINPTYCWKTPKRKFLNTYPPAKCSCCYITNDRDLEIDTILAMETTEKCLKHAPNGVPASFTQTTPDSSPLPPKESVLHVFGLRHNKEPDQKSTIYIPHKNADKPIGDEFGADVWTYQTVQKDGTIYYQHFFVNVKHDGPAAKMKIHDNDEIVLLNTIFVPNFTHTKVLNLFHLVKVDGKTRFELVLRRLEKVGSKKEWEWIDTSAILAPDHRHDVDTYPEVEKPKLKKLKSNEYAVKSFHYYKVPGTQCYLDIEHNAVVASVFTDTDADKTKIICRIDQYKFNKETGKIEFTAALCSEKMSKYIVVGTDRQIKVDDNPMWFEMTTILPNIMFKINGLFLACNTETHRIETHDTEYMFEEVPIKGGIDHPDHAMPMNLAQGNPFDMSPVIAGPPSSTACIKGEYDIYRRRKRKMSTDELQTHGNDPKDARHESESDAMHTDMRLDIPENTLFHGSRSSDILKTPTTPFRSMLTIN